MPDLPVRDWTALVDAMPESLVQTCRDFNNRTPSQDNTIWRLNMVAYIGERLASIVGAFDAKAGDTDG